MNDAPLGTLVAIDGPAGSGKSTVAKRVAAELGIGYLDTGAMYRALTWHCLELKIDLDDHETVREAADSLAFQIERSEGGAQRFFVREVDVTDAIREPRVANQVALVARNLQVRAWMKDLQRALMLEARQDGRGMVAEGRDITTVVCPDADVRILLVADPEVRLRRRALELYGSDTPEFLAAAAKQVGERDRSDATVSEFMEPAPGVEVIDSSTMSIDQVVAEIAAMVVDTIE